MKNEVQLKTWIRGAAGAVKHLLAPIFLTLLLGACQTSAPQDTAPSTDEEAVMTTHQLGSEIVQALLTGNPELAEPYLPSFAVFTAAPDAVLGGISVDNEEVLHRNWQVRLQAVREKIRQFPERLQQMLKSSNGKLARVEVTSEPFAARLADIYIQFVATTGDIAVVRLDDCFQDGTRWYLIDID
jgi:hypothetical protein